MKNNLQIKDDQIMTRIPHAEKLCYKYNTFDNLNKYIRNNAFYPLTYLYPLDKNKLINYDYKDYLIYKISSASYGEYVYIVKSYEEIEDIYKQYRMKAVVQKYIDTHLIDGYKYDIRLYLFIANINPLKLFLYNDGLVRFCSKKYVKPNDENYKDKYIHLTNTNINRLNKNKCVILDLLSETKHKIPNFDNIYKRIKEIIRLTMIANYDDIIKLTNNKNNFVQIIGVDILIDSELKPQLLEINDRPSLQYDYEWEYLLKFDMIDSIFKYLLHDKNKLNNLWTKI